LKRREILQKLAYTLPAGMIFPSLLSSCEPKDPPLKPVYEGNVIVIGAGAAGLHAAQLIKNQNVDVQILEASDLFGGRVKINSAFFDFALEQGADYIYGNNNEWYNGIKNTGVSVIEVPKNPVYVMDGVPKLDSELTEVPADIDYINAQSFIANLKNRSGPDLTLQNAVISAQINQRAHHVVEGEVATPQGTTYNNISVKGISENLKNWDGGEGKYFSENQSLIQVMSSMYNDVLPLIKFNTPITSINYADPSKIILTDNNGETHECTRVIITVPLAVLKSDAISFSPQLPLVNTSAWNLMGMSGGIKVALSFFSNFWNKTVTSIYTEGYAREYYVPGIGRSSGNRMLTATIVGDQADALEGKTEQEIIDLLLADLDAIYPTLGGQASHNFNADDSYLFDWSKQEYIKGATSYPKVSGTGAAKAMATPVQNRIFWAGEATALNGNSATVQGAMESSNRATVELFDVILDL
jgi:monoamine oxidase